MTNQVHINTHSGPKPMDQIVVMWAGTVAHGLIQEVRQYRRQYIIRFRTPAGYDSIVVAFPDRTYLPPVNFLRLDLHCDNASVMWDNHIWPSPKGQTRPLTYEAALKHAYDKIDYMLERIKDYNAQLEIFPMSDFDYQMHKAWWSN
jgi:hypothetical protein